MGEIKPPYFDSLLNFDSLQIIGSSETKVTAKWKGQEVSVDEYERLQQEEAKLNRYKSSGVGTRFLTLSLADFHVETEEQKKALEIVQEFITDVQRYKPRTLWLCGNAGTGKTMLASLIIRELGGRFCKSYQIQNELEDCRSFKAKESKTDLIKRYATYPVLVIDEIGKLESKSEIEYLFMIINERYENEVSTVIVTNKTVKAFAEYIGKPMFDRFSENCVSFDFKGTSYRGRK